MKKKIIVTGNQGFIGKALHQKLVQLNYEVFGLEAWIYQRARWQDRLHEFIVDHKPDAIFHVGACSDTTSTDVNEMMKLNVESTHVIADWCQFKSVPLIYSSSASIHGNKNSPETLYAWSKYLGELYATKCGAVALRYFNVYGNYEIPKGKMASVACQAYLKHKNGKVMRLFPNEASRDFVYINDVVDANIYALENYESFKGGYFHVGSGESSTFEEVMNIMGIPYEYTDVSEIPNNYQKYTLADSKRFMKGWSPKYNLETGLSHYKSMLDVSLPLLI